MHPAKHPATSSAQTPMIGPPPSFYDPAVADDHARYQQWAHQPPQHDYQQHQFDFAYPAPGTTFDDLLAQFYPQQQQPQAQAQYPQYPASNPVPSASTSHTNTAAPTANHTPVPAPAPAPSPKRRRPAKAQKTATLPASDNSDSEQDFGGGISVGMGGLGVASRGKGPRLPGACTYCKKLKMKCDFGPAPSSSNQSGHGGLDNTCRRCRAGGHACIVEGRKPRSAPK
ncbi:hypothetical protein B0H10DRAFT_2206810 [Mycena sp. CBHHK59/15]|nr:hypothetical protein B0H10DRAFT_2206810 [Mycena sp. CBHHK59/15]